MPDYLAAVVAAFTTCAVTGPVVLILRRYRVIDVPSARSSHVRSTPRGGGVAVLAGVTLGALAVSSPHDLWLLLGFGLGAALVGLADDLMSLSAVLRLICQLVLATGVTMAVLHMELQLTLTLQALVVAVGAVLWLAGYVNAFNFMDGINGISGVSAALAGGWFALLGNAQSEPVLKLGGLLVLGAALGFLPWNFPNARVFLGDVGSYGFGMLIGALSVWAVASGTGLLMGVAPLLLYVSDTMTTLLRRARSGSSVMSPHKEHVYQQLCDAGLGHSATAVFVSVITLLVCATVWWLPELTAIPFVACTLALYLGTPSLVRR